MTRCWHSKYNAALYFCQVYIFKRKRKAKGWTQEHLDQLVDLTPRSIMYIENRGQDTSFDAFYRIVTVLDISVDEFFYPDKHNGENERRKHIDRMLNSMNERELTIMEAAAGGIVKSNRLSDTPVV